MKNHIDPVTLQKLDEFNKRRKRLLGFRGLCAFIISTVAIFSIMAAIDSYVLLADGLRGFLTFAGWITVAGLVWGFSIRHLLGKPSRNELARYIETQEPALREDLLSAIELGSNRSNPEFDSEVFRQLLQRDVASRIKTLDIEKTLPMDLIARWLKGSAVLAAVFIALFFIPDFGKNFGTAVARTMFGANLARVSGIEITLNSPSRDELVPHGEAVRVNITLKGEKKDLGAVKKVILESAGAENERNRATMEVDEDRNYVARLNVGQSDMRFRIQAGLAQSEWFTLSARPRPSVEEFEITYNFPAYTQLEAKSQSGSSGDIEGFQGTTLGYQIRVNQPTKSGELRLDLATNPPNRSIPLQVDDKDPSVLSIAKKDFTLVAPGTYRVHLISNETGFENKYSPKYEIAVNPDQVPRVQLTQPARNLLVPADEFIGILGEADDDLPLQRVELNLRINNGRWQRDILYPVNEEDPLEQLAITIRNNLDLLKYTLSAGDRVKIKLVAFDLKGQKSDSNIIELSIISRGFEASRIETIAAQSRIAEALEELVSQLSPIAKEASETANHLKKLSSNEPQSTIQWASFADLAKRVREESARTLEIVNKTTRLLPKGAAAREAEYVQRTLGNITSDIISLPAPKLESARETLDKKLRDRYIDEARQSYHESLSRAHSTLTQIRTIAAGNLRAVLAEDLRTLAQQQVEILPNQPLPDNELTWKRLARREKAAINQAISIERNLTRFLHLFDGTSAKRYRQLAHELGESRKALDTIVESFATLPPNKDLLSPAQAFKGQIISFLEKLGSAHNSHTAKAHREHQYLITHTQDEYHPVLRIGQVARELLSQQRQAKELRTKGNKNQAKTHEDRARHFKLILAQAQWPGATGRLESRAAATESRKDSDSRFAKDTGMTARAVANLGNRFAREYGAQEGDPESIIKELDSIGYAFRTLETIHYISDLHAQVKEVAHQEKWELRHPATLINRPSEWLTAHKFMPIIGKKMRDAQLNSEATKIITSLNYKPYSRAVSTQMDTRRREVKNLNFQPKRTTEELVLVLSDIIQALRLLAPEANEARKTIEQHTPSIADLARELAEKTRKLEEETKADAKDAEATEDPETKRADIQELQDKQEALMQELSDLTNALRQDANTQDVLSEEGRERARDADDSIAMVKKPADEAEQNIEQASLAQRTDDQVRELEETAQSQEQLAQALEQVAEHYENLDKNPEAVAETRQELRAAEEELGIAQQLEEQFSQVERLAELANLDPEELLAALENELDENRVMQKELSDIAKDSLEDAQEQLEDAAEQEADIPEDLANSDQQTKNDARNIANQLRQLGQEARKISREEVNQANQSARKAQDASVADELDQIRRDLDQIGREAENAARSSNPQDIAQTAQDIVRPLEQTAEDLENAADDVAELKNTNQTNAAQRAEEAQKQAEALTQKANNAVEKSNALTEQANAAQQDAVQAQQDLFAANDAAFEAEQANDTAQQKATNNPTVNDLQDAAKDAASKANEAKQNAQQAQENFTNAVAEAQSTQQAAQQANSDAQEIRNEANQANREAQAAKTLADNFEKNPGKANEAINEARQSEQKADVASEKTEKLAEKAREIASTLAELLEDIQPTEQALDQANQAQDNIEEAGQEAAENVARAARHEERLGNQDVAEALESIAEATSDALDNQVADASDELQALDAANQLGDLADQAQDLANQEANQAQQAAQRSGEQELGQEIAETRQDVNQAAQQAEQTSNNQQANTDQLAEAAQNFADQISEAAEEFAQQAQDAQQAAQDAQQASQQSQQAAEQAQQAAQDAKQAAQDAQQAAQQAQQAAQQATQNPDNSDAQQAAQDAAQQAQQAAQDAQQAAQQAQQAQQAAQNPEPTAQEAAQQAQQASQQAQQAAQQAQQSSQQAQQAAQQNSDSPIAQEAAQTAQQAQQNADKASQEAQQASQQAQQAAQQASQNPDNTQAQESAQAASQQAQQAAAEAAQAAQEAQAAQQLAQNPEGQPQQSAQAAQQSAQQAQQAAQAAQQAAQQAQQASAQQAQQANQSSQQAQQAAQQASQAAQEASQLAESAESLAEGLNSSEPTEGAFEQPFTEASQALGEQAESLDNFFEEGLAQSESAQNLPAESPASQTPSAQSPSPQSPAAQSSAPQSSISESTAFPSDAPLSNPETAEALAQALDSLDQALAESQSAEAGTPTESGTPSESGSTISEAASEQAASPTPGAPTPGAPTPGAPTPGAPTPGAPTPGAPTPGAPTPGAPSQSLAQAAQSLAQAAAAQAAAMAQARNAQMPPGQQPKGEGMQLNSETGAAIVAGHMEYEALQELKRNADLDWGKLPAQMAKDLLEGSQEDISGEYRHQVETYFRAIAELARQKKEQKK